MNINDLSAPLLWAMGIGDPIDWRDPDWDAEANQPEPWPDIRVTESEHVVRIEYPTEGRYWYAKQGPILDLKVGGEDDVTSIRRLHYFRTYSFGSVGPSGTIHRVMVGADEITLGTASQWMGYIALHQPTETHKYQVRIWTVCLIRDRKAAEEFTLGMRWRKCP